MEGGGQLSTSMLVICVLFRDPGVTQRSIRWEDENKGTVLMHSAQPGGLRSKGGGTPILESTSHSGRPLLPSASAQPLETSPCNTDFQQFQMKSQQLPSCGCYWLYHVGGLLMTYFSFSQDIKSTRILAFSSLLLSLNLHI